MTHPIVNTTTSGFVLLFALLRACRLAGWLASSHLIVVSWRSTLGEVLLVSRNYAHPLSRWLICSYYRLLPYVHFNYRQTKGEENE